MNGPLTSNKSVDEVDRALTLSNDNTQHLLDENGELHQDDNSKSSSSSGCSSEGVVVEALNNINLGSTPTPVIGKNLQSVSEMAGRRPCHFD